MSRVTERIAIELASLGVDYAELASCLAAWPPSLLEPISTVTGTATIAATSSQPSSLSPFSKSIATDSTTASLPTPSGSSSAKAASSISASNSVPVSCSSFTPLTVATSAAAALLAPSSPPVTSTVTGEIRIPDTREISPIPSFVAAARQTSKAVNRLAGMMETRLAEFWRDGLAFAENVKTVLKTRDGLEVG
ncbi:unnamed protein product [Protopolystoma xenopodis]|uniref:Uncharacterized protein n=1 Tax=Protopolystoma xenopodis TaxID=117903 RepID=A0A3S5CGU6_9PLAT|nr:unnamed protein product [Protopolystoma xenopodis]